MPIMALVRFVCPRKRPWKIEWLMKWWFTTINFKWR
jgi:hypothetical protein